MIDKVLKQKFDKIIESNPTIKGSEVAKSLISEDASLLKKFTEQTLAYSFMEYSHSKNRVYSEGEIIDVDIKEDKPKWEVVEGFYHWKCRVRGVVQDVVMSVEAVDSIFNDYSIFGNNMTEIEVYRKHNIKDYWHSFKTKLGLVKRSERCSPYTWERMTPEEQIEYTAVGMRMAHENKQELISRTFEVETIKHYNKKILEINKSQFGSELFVSKFLQFMPEVYTNTISILPTEFCKLDWLVSVVTDIHIGLEVKNLKHSPEYNTEIIKERLAKCAVAINAKGAKENYIAFTGDLIESFTGMNHKTSWKDVQKGMTGGPLVVEAINILSDFLGQVSNIKEVIIIAGNHDRAASNKDEETDGAIAYIMAKWIGERYKNNFKVTISNTYAKLDFDDIKTRVLFEHGDKPLFKTLGKNKKEANIYEYRKFERDGYRTIIFCGHFHGQGVAAHTWDISKYECPSIVTGADYSEKLGLDSAAGITFFYKTVLGCGAVEFSDLQQYEQIKVK